MLNEKSPEMEQGREEMGEEEGEEDDQERFEGSFMELLGSEDLLMLEKDERIEVEEGFLFSPPYPSPSSSSSSCGYPQMLHFGGAHEDLLLLNGVTESSLSTLSSSSPSATGKSKSKSSKKVNSSESGGGGGGGGGRRVSAGETTTAAPSKRTKAPATIKVRKEKLGERINALQQLVSPFGKSDTATVLHEAMCYIRFLHDQVQVLSSPYLQRSQHDGGGGGGGGGEESRRDLRSLGLCLVPVSCTENVANSNGADLWSPALVGGGGSSTSSSGSKH